MNKMEYTQVEPMILLCDQVVYDPLKRTLSRGKKTINLSENESCLLKLLLLKNQ
ncbi:Uncharacterised protein [Providencia rustigianii]|nr:Uncharacterised protein [Providencia rustigianii]